ncbi:hypothetical protein OGATHE_004768 [Ogataea polymorpha]|uniref:Uncharacterized protein n=1 Tax=Ogataea polymorpha TaxID=460523 RepID=A0A9P8P1L5_9ASCO|nr:hypothetical protein OGATHE_004768 [Ogataea polymorpha]
MDDRLDCSKDATFTLDMSEFSARGMIFSDLAPSKRWITLNVEYLSERLSWFLCELISVSSVSNGSNTKMLSRILLVLYFRREAL